MPSFVFRSSSHTADGEDHLTGCRWTGLTARSGRDRAGLRGYKVKPAEMLAHSVTRTVCRETGDSGGKGANTTPFRARR